MSSAGAAMPLLSRRAGGINGDPLPAVLTQAPRKDLFFQAGGWTLATAGFATAGAVLRITSGKWETLTVSLLSAGGATGLSTLSAWYNVYKDRTSVRSQQTSMHTATGAATAQVWHEATVALRDLVSGSDLREDASFEDALGAIRTVLAKPTFPDQAAEVVNLQGQLLEKTASASAAQKQCARLEAELGEEKEALAAADVSLRALQTTLEAEREELVRAQQDLRLENRERGTASTTIDELQREVSQLKAKLTEKEDELQRQHDRFGMIGVGIRDINGALATMTARTALSPDDTFEGEPIATFDLQTDHPLYSLGQAINKLIAEVNLIHFSYDTSTSTYSSRATTPGVTPISSPARAVPFGRRVRFAMGWGDGAAAAASNNGGLDSDGEE